MNSCGIVFEESHTCILQNTTIQVKQVADTSIRTVTEHVIKKLYNAIVSNEEWKAIRPLVINSRNKMIEIQGKYNTVKVFTDTAEASAIQQIQHIVDQPFVEGSSIRVMPDIHACIGGTVGMTMTITDKCVPNFIGTDCGCGMLVTVIKDKRLDFNQFDKAVHQNILAGFKVRQTPHHFMDEIDLSELRCARHVNIDRAALSLGTLGGGNHFIEASRDDDRHLYIIVHTGSRNLGNQLCTYYQNAAADALGRTNEGDDRFLAYCEGDLLDDYLHDMRIVQHYADLNRLSIVKELSKHIKFKIGEQFTTIHNYIDLDTMILRKGAVSAKQGERLIVPMNMRDGSLLCVGKGNADWNYTAPHGAGRIMSRADTKAQITLTQYEKAMKGVFSTTVNRNTIDEAPFAYKPMSEIIENSSETLTVEKILKPLYNFKAGQE